LTQYRSVTDGRTDRRTDRRICRSIYSACKATFAAHYKNASNVCCSCIVSTFDILAIKCCNIVQVYETELEKVPEFKKFRDFCQSFKLSRGKNADEMETSVAGEFKVLNLLPAYQKCICLLIICTLQQHTI